MADFQEAFEITLNHEGGYANDPDDRGGETYKGIARKHHPDWLGWEIIDRMKDRDDFPHCLEDNNRLQEHVEQFYKRTFWDVASLDEMECQELAEELFDIGVNQGISTAIKYLQESLNLLNRGEQDYQDTNVDGVWGPDTAATLKQYQDTANWSTRNQEDIYMVLLKTIDAMQAERYINIVRNDTSQQKFFFGWMKRL